MCSVGDDFDGEKYMLSEAPINLENEICKKCKTKPSTVILRKKDCYCDDCFVAGVIHKFRAALGKSKMIRPGEKVLIAHSGSINSTVLSYLVKDGLEEATHKKLRFAPTVAHIDEGRSDDISKEDRTATSKAIMDESDSYNLPCYIIGNGDMKNEEDSDLLFIDKISHSTDAIKSVTAKLDLLKKMRQNVLLKCARRMECSHVLLAETATMLAANLLANVALGGGSHLSSDTGFVDSRNKNIKILRPLNGLTSEDINLFVKIKNLNVIRDVVKYNDPYESIQSLTSEFVNKLQNDFPATIPTVLRTGEKIENTDMGVDEDQQCALCQSALDTEASQCSAVEATQFSKETSSESPCKANSNEKSCVGCACKSTTTSMTKEEIFTFLCYSCRLIIKDINDIDSLPSSLLDKIKLKKELQKMKQSIQDFLL